MGATFAKPQVCEEGKTFLCTPGFSGACACKVDGSAASSDTAATPSEAQCQTAFPSPSWCSSQGSGGGTSSTPTESQCQTAFPNPSWVSSSSSSQSSSCPSAASADTCKPFFPAEKTCPPCPEAPSQSTCTSFCPPAAFNAKTDAIKVSQSDCSNSAPSDTSCDGMCQNLAAANGLDTSVYWHYRSDLGMCVKNFCFLPDQAQTPGYDAKNSPVWQDENWVKACALSVSQDKWPDPGKSSIVPYMAYADGSKNCVPQMGPGHGNCNFQCGPWNPKKVFPPKMNWNGGTGFYDGQAFACVGQDHKWHWPSGGVDPN